MARIAEYNDRRAPDSERAFPAFSAIPAFPAFVPGASPYRSCRPPRVSPQQCLNFFPLPHGHGAFRPTFG
jgi:hypothetical protein